MFSVEKGFEAPIARTSLNYLISLSLCTSFCFHDSKKAKKKTPKGKMRFFSDKIFFSFYQSAVYLSLCFSEIFFDLPLPIFFGLSLLFSSLWLHIYFCLVFSACKLLLKTAAGVLPVHRMHRL